MTDITCPQCGMTKCDDCIALELRDMSQTALVHRNFPGDPEEASLPDVELCYEGCTSVFCPHHPADEPDVWDLEDQFSALRADLEQYGYRFVA